MNETTKQEPRPFDGIVRPEIGAITEMSYFDLYKNPKRGLRISLSRSGSLVYDEDAARELLREVTEIINRWDNGGVEARSMSKSPGWTSTLGFENATDSAADEMELLVQRLDGSNAEVCKPEGGKNHEY